MAHGASTPMSEGTALQTCEPMGVRTRGRSLPRRLVGSESSQPFLIPMPALRQ